MRILLERKQKNECSTVDTTCIAAIGNTTHSWHNKCMDTENP